MNLFGTNELHESTLTLPNEYAYELAYDSDDELLIYYNKLVLSLYGTSILEFIDGNRFNLTSGNVKICK